MAVDARKATIRALPVGQLAAAIAQGEYSALEVLRAYRDRAEEVDQACNAVTHWFQDCEDAARRADEHLRSTGTTLGPLHGVPFTLKDHVDAVGTPMTLNMQTLRRQVEERKRRGEKIGPNKDEAVVTALKSLGAIPFAKTTMTQMGDTWGGGGPAHGDTLNPWDTLRTSGGSSSGEGALIGGGASPFGIGSDIGGSVRIPSAFCGIATLKPTVGRLARLFSTPGDYSIPATLGVMAKTVEDVALLYTWLFSPRLYDHAPRMARIPFDTAEFSSTRKLRIGYYYEEYTQPKPCPAVRRAVDEAVEVLRRCGHDLVPFRPHSEGILTQEQFRGSDWSFVVSKRPPRRSAGSAKAKQQGSGELRAKVLPAWAAQDEPIHPDLAANGGSHPDTKVEGFEYAGTDGVPGWLRLLDRRDSLRKRFYDAWRQVGLDAVVCPAFGLPACQVEEVRHLAKASETTRIYNFLDMPAGVVPLTRVSEADLRQPYEPGHWDPAVNRAALRCLEGAAGLPVAVQVVAAPWREELALRVMRELQALAPFTGHSDLTPMPRRSPEMGARPEPIPRQPLSKYLLSKL